MNEVKDAQLLERSRRGEERAFSELYRRYQAGIYRYAVHMCGASAGDDVVQETFLAVLRQRGRTDAPRQTVAGYLFGIARHVVLQRLGSKYAPLTDSGDDDVSEVASGALTALTTSPAPKRLPRCERRSSRCRWFTARLWCCATCRRWSTRQRRASCSVR